MGVFDIRVDDVFEIHNPAWGDEYCRARKTVLVADEEWVTNQLVKIKNDFQQQGSRAFRRQKQNMSMDAQIGAANRLWVFRMLVDWNFTKDRMPMPLKLEAVQQLPQHILDYIYERIMAEQPKDDEEAEQGDEEEDPTTSSVLHSTDGDTDSLMDLPSQEAKTNRNHLLQPPKF